SQGDGSNIAAKHAGDDAAHRGSQTAGYRSLFENDDRSDRGYSRSGQQGTRNATVGVKSSVNQSGGRGRVLSRRDQFLRADAAYKCRRHETFAGTFGPDQSKDCRSSGRKSHRQFVHEQDRKLWLYSERLQETLMRLPRSFHSMGYHSLEITNRED